jgi:quinol monooxygenase YgiN
MEERDRREFMTAIAAVAVTSALPGCASAQQEKKPMYGLMGKMKVAPGKRGEVIRLLLDGTTAMPGCLSYVVAEDPTDPDAIWITEVWDSKESHEASLRLPSVREAIAQARPLITGFGERFETVPVGGIGLLSGG